MMKTNDKNPRRFELPEVIFKWECNRHVSQHKGSAVGKWGSKVGSEENEGSVVGNHLRDQHDCVFFIKDLETTPNKQSDWLVYERLLLFIALCLLFGIFLTITLSLISDILLLLGDYMVFLKLFFYRDKQIYAKYLHIFNSHLKMTSGMSKCRGFDDWNLIETKRRWYPSKRC